MSNLRKFSDKFRLKRHSIVHAEVKQFACNHCEKKFSTSTLLYCHKRKHKANEVHQEKVKFKCNQCDKTFLRRSVLKKHILTHNPERPYECECSAKFRTKYQLAEHRLIHSEEAKKFICSHCDKKFLRLRQLKIHEAVHNEKYSCKFCSKKFAKKSLMILHEKNHESKNQNFDIDSNSIENELAISADESVNETRQSRRVTKSKNEKDDMKLEFSSDPETEKTVKEKSSRKNEINKSRRKPKTPKKIKINFPKSNK